MTYTVTFTKECAKQIRKLDKPVKERVQKAVELIRQDPSQGKPLVGVLSGRWSYRVGDYRLLYKVNHHQLLILMLTVGHRRDVYS